MPGDYNLGDVTDDKAFIDAQRASQSQSKALRTSQSTRKEPRNSLTAYGLSDAMQGAALYKPSGISYDAFNQELSKELQNLGTEPGWKVRDDKLNPYDVFIKDPVQRNGNVIGANAAASSNGTTTTDGGSGGSSQGQQTDRLPTPGGMVYPLISVFTVTQPWKGGGHQGVDIGCPTGTDVLAAKDGVAKPFPQPGWGSGGNTLLINHGGGTWTIYMHLDSFMCQDGDQVKAGQVVAKSGNSDGGTGNNTGPHLHFEVWEGIAEGGLPTGGTGQNVNCMPYIGL